MLLDGTEGLKIGTKKANVIQLITIQIPAIHVLKLAW